MVNDIGKLIARSGTSLAEMRELMPKLAGAVQTPLTALPGEPRLFTAAEAKDLGVTLDEGWMLKLTPAATGEGYTFSVITPEKWEITQDDAFISPTGERFTRSEAEQLLAAQEQVQVEEEPWLPGAILQQATPMYSEYLKRSLAPAPTLPPSEIQAMFGQVFPDLDFAEIVAYIEETPEKFIEDLRAIGRNERTEALVRFLVPDITEAEFQDLFATVPEYEAEGWFKDNVLDPLYAGAVSFVHGLKTAFSPKTGILPALLRRIATLGRGQPQFGGIPQEEVAGRLQAACEEGEQGFLRLMAENEAWMAEHPEVVIAKPEYSESPFENPALFRDPGYYAYCFGSSLAYSLSVMGTLIAVSVAASPAVGIPAAIVVAGGPEATAMTQELVKQGVPLDEAAPWGALYGLSAGGIETVSDLPFVGLIFKPIGQVMKPMWNTIFRGVASRLGKMILTGVVITQTEGLEELVTQAVHNAILKHYDETQSILEGLSHSYIQGVIASLPFGVIGGGASFRTFRNNLSPDIGQRYDEQLRRFQDAGLTLEEAQVQAANEIAKTAEGEAALTRALEVAQQEYWAEHDIAPVVEPVILKVAPVTPEVTIPKAEPGMPEAGYQPGMLPEVLGKEVRPQPRARIVQISMQDEVKLQQARKAARETPAPQRAAYEAEAELEGLTVTHENDPVAQARFKLGGKNVDLTAFISIREQTFPEYFTIKQALAIKPHMNLTPYTQPGTPLYQRVPRRDVLDELADKWGMTQDEIAHRVMQIRQEKRQIKELQETIKREMTERPLPAVPEVRTQEVAENWETPGQPKYTLQQAQALAGFFGEYVLSESTLAAYELQRALWSKTRAQRSQDFKARMQELVADGMSIEVAFKQAVQETLAGKLPIVTTDFFELMNDDLRGSLFAVVFHNKQLQQYPLEMVSTLEALTNAITGRPIPRKRGTGTPLFPEGGSAWDRLNFVFGKEQPRLLKAIDKMAEQGKSLKDVTEGVFHETGRAPIPIDEETARYLRNLKDVPLGYKTLFATPSDLHVSDLRSPAELELGRRQLELAVAFAEGKIDESTYKIESLEARDKAYPPPPITEFESPISDAFKELPLLKIAEKNTINRVLKELLMAPIDIGNFLRANKASFDMSFWRQQKTLTPGHPVSFYRANVEAWKALFSKKDAEANWEWVKRRPSYPYYANMIERTGHDFLRPLELPKGTSQWKGVEEFGYITGERLIPRLTGKIPWVKVSSRAFVTGTNTHNILIYDQCLRATMRLNEKIAAGEIKLKEGEAFSIQQEMDAYATYIGDMTQRAHLGKAAPLAPALGAMFFAPRSKLGRLLTPRHLLSKNPRVRALAWKDLSLFVGTISGLVMTGYWLGLWDVERDPRNAEFMSIRIGNMRIDPWAGNRQFVTLYARLMTGTGISSVTGKEYEVNPIAALTTLVRTSLAPLTSIILDFWTGKNFLGEEVAVEDKRQWLERILPFALQDVWEAWEDDWRHGVIAILPGIFGEGVQTYSGDWAENWAKLGLPKYLENTGYGITEPIYDLADLWADHAAQFKGVDPATLTESKGFPEYIRSLAEALQVIETINILPNQGLISINADPSKGATVLDYYKMWQDRQKIVASGDEEKLKEFDADERTRNAYLGNMTQSQYALLVEYHQLPPEEQKAFLTEHPELTLNPREDWLKAHPEQNALLALWGKAKILTMDAYNELKKLVDSLDVPENALPKHAMPPEGSVENYFKYGELGEEFGWNSWETRLLLLEDDELRQWLEREPITDNVEALELQVKHRTLTEEYEGYGDRDSPFYVEDKDTREEARQLFRADHAEWVEDMNRVDAYQLGFADDLIENYVEYYRLSDKGYRRERYLLENPDFYATMTLPKDQGGKGLVPFDLDYRVPDVRYDEIYEEYEDLFEAYENVTGTQSEREARREQLLRKNGAFARARLEREAYDKFRSIEGDSLHKLVNQYADYYSIQKKSGVDYSAGWYEDDWFLMDNADFYRTMVALGLWQPKDFAKVPTREVWKLYQTYLGLPTGTPRFDYRARHPELDAWLVLAKGYKAITDRGSAGAEQTPWEELEEVRRFQELFG